MTPTVPNWQVLGPPAQAADQARGAGVPWTSDATRCFGLPAPDCRLPPIQCHVYHSRLAAARAEERPAAPASSWERVRKTKDVVPSHARAWGGQVQRRTREAQWDGGYWLFVGFRGRGMQQALHKQRGGPSVSFTPVNTPAAVNQKYTSAVNQTSAAPLS